MKRIFFVVATILLLAFAVQADGKEFKQFLTQLESLPDSTQRAQVITEYLASTNVPVIEGTSVYFVYRGKGNSVAVPGEMSRWSPGAAMMQRVPGTDLFYYCDTLPPGGRMEYKIWVDSVWMLDPLNPKTSRGGFGDNSDVWMPGYQPTEISYSDSTLSRGTLDSLEIRSEALNLTHPVFINTPAKISQGEKLPVIYVTDGHDYLTLGKMNIVLDNLISAKRIRPVIGVFIDPRTDLHDNSTNRRMREYAASDAYLDFLEKEVAPWVESRYPVSSSSTDRVILGASMGGLISAYTVLTRPHFISKCAAQSPAFWQAESVVVKLAEGAKSAAGLEIYVDAGTLRDTEVEARLVSSKLKEKGAGVVFTTYPEGHNWTNWRARLDEVLEHFFAAR